MQKMSELLGADKKVTNDRAKVIRDDLVRQVKRNLDLVERAERHAFGAKSYYYCRQHNISRVASDPQNASPALERTMQETGGEQSGGGS